MKAGNDALRCVIQRLQMGQRIALRDGQAALGTGSQHAGVQIYALGGKASILQQFQPFATTATQVDGIGWLVDAEQWGNKGLINLQPSE